MVNKHRFAVGQRIQVIPPKRADLSWVYGGLQGTVAKVHGGAFPQGECGYKVVFDATRDRRPAMSILPEHCLVPEGAAG